jgi:hypothetical protein
MSDLCSSVSNLLMDTFMEDNILRTYPGERNKVPNFLVVITDGKSNGNIPVISEASILHKSTNIETFAIGVGQGVNKPELDAMASSPSHVLFVTDCLLSFSNWRQVHTYLSTRR